jgi:serine/threonine-protein kinase
MKTCPHCDAGYADSHFTCPTHGVLLSEITDLQPDLLLKNNYRIIRKIAEGEIGAVYLAVETLMGKPRVLKFLSRSLSGDVSFTDSLRRELRTLSQVRHKNVINSGDLERAGDGTLFFAKEYVNGPNVHRLQCNTTNPFPAWRALEIARGIAEGLGAAHSKGMVHRDIRPENILMLNEGNYRVGNEWVPKIAGFGIVASKERSATYRKTGGTLLAMAYAAPEQWRGVPAEQLDGRTDLYALGGVLFDMLTGETVFDAENYEGWAWEHANRPPRPPSESRPELVHWRGLDELVLRLLSKDLEDRPRDAAEVLKLITAIEHISAMRSEALLESPPPAH